MRMREPSIGHECRPSARGCRGGRTRARALAGLVLVAAAALVLSGCQAPWQEDPRLENTTLVLGNRATVLVTTDGGTELVVRRTVPLKRHTTALEALQFVADVKLGPGKEVVRVNGLSGGRLTAMGPDQSQGRYRINGVEGHADPARLRVPRGSVVWWDLRRFDIHARIPVAIGAFPETLFVGYRGNDRPLRIAYGKGFEEDAEFFRESVFSELEPEVRPLREDGGGVAGVGGRDGPDYLVAVREDRANLVIGRWEEIRLDPYISDIGTDPPAFGLTVWIVGTDVWRRGAADEFPQELDDAEGVVWATTVDGEPDGAVVFVVTGVTDEGVRAAARALKRGELQFMLAAAVDRDGVVL
jgi:hypothetical protein